MTSFVEKPATEAGPDAKYFGILLTLKSPGNEELSYPFSELFVSTDQHATYYGCRLLFDEVMDLKSRHLSCEIVLPTVSHGRKRYISPRLHTIIHKDAVIPCHDVGFYVHDYRLTTKSSDHGWVKLGALPVSMETDLPRIRDE
ncbi:hypothetical protein GYB59_13825 [bacterium]|nr:hypothetical protein [bacterium]